MVVCFLGTMPVVFGNQQVLGEDGAQKIREKLKEPLLRLLSSSEFASIVEVKKRWSDAKVAIDGFEKDLDVLMAQKVEPKAEIKEAPKAVPVEPKEEVKSATKEEIQKELAGKEKEITEEIKALQPTLKDEEMLVKQMQVPVEPVQAPVVETPVIEKPAEVVPVEAVPVETSPVVDVVPAVVPAQAPDVVLPEPTQEPAPEIIQPPASVTPVQMPEMTPQPTPEQAPMPMLAIPAGN